MPLTAETQPTVEPFTNKTTLKDVMNGFVRETFDLSGINCYSPEPVAKTTNSSISYRVKIVGAGISGNHHDLSKIGDDIENFWKQIGITITRPADQKLCESLNILSRVRSQSSIEDIQGVSSNEKFVFHLHLSSTTTELTIIVKKIYKV